MSSGLAKHQVRLPGDTGCGSHNPIALVGLHAVRRGLAIRERFAVPNPFRRNFLSLPHILQSRAWIRRSLALAIRRSHEDSWGFAVSVACRRGPNWHADPDPSTRIARGRLGT